MPARTAWSTRTGTLSSPGCSMAAPRTSCAQGRHPCWCGHRCIVGLTLPICSQVTSSGVSTREERAQAVASYRPRGSSAATLADDDVVKLERGRNNPGGQASFWESRVEGGRWTRSWGYLAQVAPFCLSLAPSSPHPLCPLTHCCTRVRSQGPTASGTRVGHFRYAVRHYPCKRDTPRRHIARPTGTST